MPLATDARSEVAQWVNSQTAWRMFVTLDGYGWPESGVFAPKDDSGRCPDGTSWMADFHICQGERWDVPLQLVCGLEHDGAAPSPPGGEGNGGKGR